MAMIGDQRQVWAGSETPHGVRDREKYERLKADMLRSGWRGRPLVGYDDGNGVHFLTGSHRAAAARAVGMEDIPCYVVDARHTSIPDEDDDEHVETCWACRLIMACDDEERLDAARESGDQTLIDLLEKECE